MGLGLVSATAPPSSRKSCVVTRVSARPSAQRRTTVIAGLHFILGAVIVLVVTPAFALFVSEFGSQHLSFASPIRSPNYTGSWSARMPA